MVVPIVPQVFSYWELPERARREARRLKQCVLALWLVGIIDLCVNPFHGLSTVLLASMGTALLAEDPQVTPCFRLLSTVSLQDGCAHGMPMLMPFLFMCDAYVLLDGMDLATQCSEHGLSQVIQVPVYDVFAGVWLCELYAAVLTWRIVREVMPRLPEPGDYLRSDGQNSSSPLLAGAAADDTGGGGRVGGGQQLPAARPIVPYSGPGHHLVTPPDP